MSENRIISRLKKTAGMTRKASGEYQVTSTDVLHMHGGYEIIYNIQQNGGEYPSGTEDLIDDPSPELKNAVIDYLLDKYYGNEDLRDAMIFNACETNVLDYDEVDEMREEGCNSEDICRVYEEEIESMINGWKNDSDFSINVKFQ